MEIKVKLSNLRTAPRKARQVVDLVRGKKVLEAQSILLFTVNKTARPVMKLLNSAIDSATKNYHLDTENLFISTITVDEGPKLKRWHPMSRGRAYPIMKRSCHIALTISDGVKAVKETKNEVKPVKTEKPTVKAAKPAVKKEVKKQPAAAKTKAGKVKK